MQAGPLRPAIAAEETCSQLELEVNTSKGKLRELNGDFRDPIDCLLKGRETRCELVAMFDSNEPRVPRTD